MREIKFRAWDDHYKYMNYKVLVGMWGKESLNDENYTACSMYIMPDKVDYKCEPHWANFEPYMEDIHLMQYTGLKDRNGKEIYEGDILLRELYSSRDNSLFLKACFVVEFGEEGGFDMIKQYEQRDYKKWKKEYEKDKKYKQPLGSNFGVKLSEVKVIGNIYENPELLEVIE